MATLSNDPDRLRAALRSTREQLESSLGELRGAMDESLRWRSWVRRRPWSAMSIAVLIGLRLGRGRWI
jgi:hypothetical protein